MFYNILKWSLRLQKTFTVISLTTEVLDIWSFLIDLDQVTHRFFTLNITKKYDVGFILRSVFLEQYSCLITFRWLKALQCSSFSFAYSVHCQRSRCFNSNIVVTVFQYWTWNTKDVCFALSNNLWCWWTLRSPATLLYVTLRQ